MSDNEKQMTPLDAEDISVALRVQQEQAARRGEDSDARPRLTWVEPVDAAQRARLNVYHFYHDFDERIVGWMKEVEVALREAGVQWAEKQQRVKTDAFRTDDKGRHHYIYRDRYTSETLREVIERRPSRYDWEVWSAYFVFGPAMRGPIDYPDMPEMHVEGQWSFHELRPGREGGTLWGWGTRFGAWPLEGMLRHLYRLEQAGRQVLECEQQQPTDASVRWAAGQVVAYSREALGWTIAMPAYGTLPQGQLPAPFYTPGFWLYLTIQPSARERQDHAALTRHREQDQAQRLADEQEVNRAVEAARRERRRQRLQALPNEPSDDDTTEGETL